MDIILSQIKLILFSYSYEKNIIIVYYMLSLIYLWVRFSKLWWIVGLKNYRIQFMQLTELKNDDRPCIYKSSTYTYAHLSLLRKNNFRWIWHIKKSKTTLRHFNLQYKLWEFNFGRNQKLRCWNYEYSWNSY